MAVRVARLLLAVILLAVGLAVAILPARPAWASPQLNGGGSGFAGLEIDQWRADVARKPYNLDINYVAQGSTVGRLNFASGLFDYGVSDVVYNPQDGGSVDRFGQPLDTKRCGQPLKNCFQYVPVSAGGLSFMYNFVDDSGRRVSTLQLTAQQVCGIFTFNITNWNQLPGFGSFDRQIKVVVRQDGAGESYVLSQYCAAVDPGDWARFRQQVGGNDPALAAGLPTSSWPENQTPVLNPRAVVAAVSTADTVADTVASPTDGQNSITYVAAGYAKVRNFPVASVQNAAGVFQQPDESNVTVALGYATADPNIPGTFVLNFGGPDPRAYFPSTYSYVLAQTAGWDPAKGAALGQFLCYSVGFGQVIAPSLRYARLSSAVVAISVNAISHIPAAPQPGQCTAGAPPAPPPPTVLGGPGSGTTATSANSVSAAGSGAGGAGGTAGANSATTAASAGQAGGPGAGGPASTDTSGSDSGGQQAALGLTPDSQAATAKHFGPTNGQVLWALFDGALLCAVVAGLIGWRKRSAAGG
jgi:phosphate transport system substrate-binding protein